METRFVRAEMDMMKRLAAFLSELLFLQDDMKRLDDITDDRDRVKTIIDNTASLAKDLLDTAPDNQRRHFATTLNDYKIELVPKLKPGSQNVLLSKEQAKELVEFAQEKCKMCIEDSESAKKCPLAKLLETTALPDRYDSMLCPFSLAKWAD